MTEYIFKIIVTEDGVLFEYPTEFDGSLAKSFKEALALSCAVLTSEFIGELQSQAKKDQNGFLRDELSKLKVYEVEDENDMTKQFKFGDLVSCESYPTTGVIVGLDETGNIATVCFVALYRLERVETKSLKLIPHPDTVRLNFIERVINIDGMVKREMSKGWTLVDDDVELNMPKPLLRDAIDEAMHLITGNKP